MLSERAQQEYLNEVSERLADFSATKPLNLYNSPTPVLGLSVPQSRCALKQGYSFLSLQRDEILEVWNYIWQNARYFEEMSQPIYFYEKKTLLPDEFAVISGWINRCDNWAHSDGLSSIYSKALEENPKMVLPMLKQWNTDKNPWKRRQSVVSLLYYTRLRKKILPFTALTDMIEPLLHDPEYYVQKGIGWTIREIYNAFPEPAVEFIAKKNLEISSTAWQAASEKLPPDFKQQLLAQRSRKHGSTKGVWQ
jgi:3-methyladenine DNA glycosylase AlkD